MNRSLRNLPTLAVIAVLFVVAFAGGANAAKLITGKQIKNGTVTGADVKAGSLKGSDVKDGSLRSADLAGDARTVARKVSASNNAHLATCDSDFFGGCPGIASLNVGSGTWFVQGTITVSNNVAAESEVNTCGLRDTTQNLNLDKAEFQLFPFETAGSRNRIALQGIVTTAGIGVLQIRCTERASDTLLANDITITAISLDDAS